MSVPSRPARWVPALALAGALALGSGSAIAAGPGATAATVAGALTLAVDANEAPRGILHARLSVPVSQGPLTLAYPKWI
ncbi:MAG: peptidase M61, partial [Candidatus Eisenbacteria bacterium]